MDYQILKSKLVYKNMTYEELATRMEAEGASITEKHLGSKIRGKYEFNRAEIKAIKKVLNLSDAEVMDIFFDGEGN